MRGTEKPFKRRCQRSSCLATENLERPSGSDLDATWEFPRSRGALSWGPL